VDAQDNEGAREKELDMNTTKRNRRMRWIALTAIALTVPLLTLAAPGERGPRGFGPGDPGARLERLAERLGLSEEQREQVGQTLAGQREAAVPLMEQKREAGAALREAIRTDTFDEPAIREAATKVAEIDVELAVLRAQSRQQLREILDAEQLAQLDAMRERRGFGHGRRGPRPGGLCGPSGENDF
jgi:Spy/CpxP family protein refolding chaperone